MHSFEELRDHLAEVRSELEREDLKPERRTALEAERDETTRAMLLWLDDGRHEDRGLAPLGRVSSSSDGDEAPRSGSRDVDAALRTIDRTADHFETGAGDALEELVRAGESHDLAARYVHSVGDASYLSAFGKWLASPTDAHLRWTPYEHAAWQRVVKVQAEQRAMNIGTAGDGGYAIPLTIDPSLIHIGDSVVNPMRSLARVVRGVSNEWRGVTSTAVVVSRDAEAAEVSDDSPTLAQPVVKASKVQGFIPFSIELGADWNSLQSELLSLLVEAKDVEESASFVLGAGDGSTGPQGVVTGATAASTTFDAAGIKSVKQALSPRYQPASRWLANPVVLDAVYDLVPAGSTTANPLMPTREGNLLGRPFSEASEMTDAVTSGEKSLLIGDFSRFLIYDRIGMSIEVIPALFGANQRPTGERGLYAFWRNTSVVLDANAFQLLTVS